MSKYIVTFNTEFHNFIKFHRAVLTLALGYDHGREKDKAMAWYNAIYQDFRDRIPADRRIEYRVQEGWQPLCKHLGVPVLMIKDEKTGEMVEAPFPRVNDRVSFNLRVEKTGGLALAGANEKCLAFIGRLAIWATSAYLCGRVGWLLAALRVGTTS